MNWKIRKSEIDASISLGISQATGLSEKFVLLCMQRGLETKEQITGLKVCDSPPSENTQTFIDAADQWWNSRDYEHKREIYNRYNSKNE